VYALQSTLKRTTWHLISLKTHNIRFANLYNDRNSSHSYQQRQKHENLTSNARQKLKTQSTSLYGVQTTRPHKHYRFQWRTTIFFITTATCFGQTQAILRCTITVLYVPVYITKPMDKFLINKMYVYDIRSIVCFIEDNLCLAENICAQLKTTVDLK
jgi:hypothetical protein